MHHKRISIFLLLAGVMAFLGGAVVFGVYVPSLARECKSMYPEMARLYWPMLLCVWAIGAVYAAALTFYMLISARIGRDQSFCPQNARDMRRIAWLLYAAAALWLGLACGPSLFSMDIGPTALAFVLLALASGAMGMVAYALWHLLQRASSLQEENDLTV